MLVVATRDVHPPGHCSFKEQGGDWPPHCVRGTPGAAFHPGLVLPEDVVEIQKATTIERDAYSGFDGTDLVQRLRKAGIKHVYVGGLATDVCVKATVLDAIRNGFSVTVIRDAIAAVNVHPSDGDRAILKMVEAGAQCLMSSEIHALQPDSALIIVDVQRDFCPGGALAVPGGDQVVVPLNKMIARFG